MKNNIAVFFSFITYRSCKHLDGKHTVFGKLVGGMDTLTQMEKVEVDNKDRPIEYIIIESAQVFVDPFKEALDELAKERAAEAEKQAQTAAEVKKQKRLNEPLKVYRQGVGKYLNLTTTKISKASENSASTDTSKKKQKSIGKGIFGDFSSW